MLWRHTNVINDVTHYENSHVICREISHVIVNNMTMQLITTPRWIMGASVTCLLIFVKVVCIHQTRTSNHRLQSRCRSKDRLSHDTFWTGIQTLFLTICLLKDRLSHDLFFFFFCGGIQTLFFYYISSLKRQKGDQIGRYITWYA